MARLNKKEREWLEKVQNVLNECPSDRIAFYTIGDRDISAYDNTKYDEIVKILDTSTSDFGAAAESANATFNKSLVFINPVESTAG